MSDSEIYIFAGGGTGGHLYPGLAVAAELSALRPDAKIVFACSNRAIDREILGPLACAIVPQPVRPLPRGPLAAVGFLRAWRASMKLAADLIADLRPAAVLGLGGFAAGPVVRRGSRRGVRCALLNPDAVPGKANLYLARYVEVIFTQFARTGEHFPPRAAGKVRHVGCPVRGELARGDPAAARRHFQLAPDRKTLLVLGGSLGAATINEAVAALGADLDEVSRSWQVLHITGRAKRHRPHGAKEREILIRRVEYCDRMDLAYACADLVLARAGAGTVAELAATGTPAVLMPYPYHADNHQRLNAEALTDVGAAEVCDDARDAAANAAALRGTLMGIMKDDSRLARMNESARSAEKPPAAREVARWLAGGLRG